MIQILVVNGDGGRLAETCSSFTSTESRVQQAASVEDGLRALGWAPKSASDPQNSSVPGADAIAIALSGESDLEAVGRWAAEVPIVAVVDQHREPLGQAALEAGAQDYLLHETLSPEVALRAVRYAIEIHRKNRQTAAQALQIQMLQARVDQEISHRRRIEKTCVQDIQEHTEELEAEIVQRRRVEKQLHHQVTNLEIIFRAFPDAIIFLDGNCCIRKVSSALTTLFGYRPEAILGKPMDVLYQNPEDCLILGEQRFSVFAEETFEPYNIYYQRQDGSTFIGETIGTIVKDAAGHVIGFLGIIRDITQRYQLMQERDRAQAALAYREAQLQQFVKHMPAAIAMFDTQMCHLFHSDRWLKDHSLGGVDITGKCHYDLFPNLPSYWRARYQQCLTGQILHREEEVVLQADGTKQWVEWELRPWYQASGEIGGVLVLMETITPRKTAQLRLEESEARFRAFMDNNLAIAFMKDDAGRYLYINKPFEKFAGRSEAELLAQAGGDWLPENAARRLRQHDEHVLATGRASQRLETIPTADGDTYWMVCKFPCSTARGAALGGVAFNITEQKQIEQELFREKELAQVTLQSIGDAVITTDAEGKITYLNSAAERLTAWPLIEAIGSPLSQVFHAVDEVTRMRVQSPADQVLKTGAVVGFSGNIALISRSGEEFSIVDSAAPIKDRDGKTVGVVLVFHDVTESRALSQQLVWQASHDTLTGLKNRRYFERELNSVLEQSRRQHVLCYLDLDQFKVVNDTGGHAAGDELLRQIGAMLLQNTRSDDVVARLGGDEFGILLKHCPLENARRVMDLIRQMIKDFRFAWEDKSFGVGVSIGVVEINETMQNLADVLGAADAACYAAKERGRNRLYLYHADDQELSQQRKEQQWITRIQQALDQNRFQLYRQPIAPTDWGCRDLEEGCGVQSQAVHHYEILLRLINEEGGVVPPMAFIPAAERYGLMPAIDRWVVDAFFEQANQPQSFVVCDTQGPGETGFYTLNLSGASINDEQFLPFLKGHIIQSAIPPEALCFEITETVAVSNLNRARDFIQEIKQLGCAFALDDFGSGMSSFGYLKHLAVNYIKIDGSFVRNLLEDNISTSIVEAITNIAHSMGLEAIAERVEDVETQHKLLALNVDYVQGYGIGKPAPLPTAPAPQLKASAAEPSPVLLR
ncbi:MAG: EAL domain-containing protein [Elainellaceae cyanobacterium]